MSDSESEIDIFLQCLMMCVHVCVRSIQWFMEISSNAWICFSHPLLITVNKPLLHRIRISSAPLLRHEEQFAGLSHTGNVPAGAEFLTPTPTAVIIHIKEHLSQMHS